MTTPGDVPRACTATRSNSAVATSFGSPLVTARPTVKGAMNVKAVSRTMAIPGLIAREAIAVATMSAASWKPLVKSNSATMATTSTSNTVIRSTQVAPPVEKIACVESIDCTARRRSRQATGAWASRASGVAT